MRWLHFSQQKPAASLLVMQSFHCKVQFWPWKFLQATVTRPKLFNHARRPMLHFTHIIHTCRTTSAPHVRVFSELVLLCWEGNFPSKCQLLPRSLPFVFPRAPDTPAFPCVLLVVGLGGLFVFLFCVSFWNKLNSLWAILCKGENPLACGDLIKQTPWPPFPAISGNRSLLHQHGVELQLKNTSLKTLCWMGRADLPSPFVVSENTVIPAGPKHGDDLWPGRNLRNIF